MTKPLVVQFGAGSIGRSLVGQLFSRAGWQVIFVDVADDIIDALNSRHGYEVAIRDTLLPGEPATIPVTNVSGIRLRDDARVRDALARADLAGTSVGAGNLPGVARLIAESLSSRSAALPVMLCENLHGAAAVLTRHVEEALETVPDRDRAVPVHCINAAISKMVPPIPGDIRARDPLTVYAEAYNTLYLDRDAYPGTPPVVPGVAWRESFDAYVDRKLLLHNFGHAATAYAGHLAGKHYIHECMEDERVRDLTAGAMMETARGLAVRHPDVFTFDENRAWADDLLRRFKNQALADPVYRVGRDLRRKLARDDRCIGALRLLRETNQPSSYATRAVAASMFFSLDDGNALPDDQEIVRMAHQEGPEAVLTTISGLDPNEDKFIIDAVAREYRRFAKR